MKVSEQNKPIKVLFVEQGPFFQRKLKMIGGKEDAQKQFIYHE